MSDTEIVVLRCPFDFEGQRYERITVRMPTPRDRSILGFALNTSHAMQGNASDFALSLVAQFSDLSMTVIDEMSVPDCADIYHLIAARFRELGAELDANA